VQNVQCVNNLPQPMLARKHLLLGLKRHLLSRQEISSHGTGAAHQFQRWDTLSFQNSRGLSVNLRRKFIAKGSRKNKFTVEA
jgi:hypothetical protein